MADDRSSLKGEGHIDECAGCSELRHQLDDLRNMLMTTQFNEHTHCCSTAQNQMTDRQQENVDRFLLQTRHKTDKLQDDCQTISEENEQLKRELADKINEISLLSEQNAVCVADFYLEREDRERSQGRLVEMEQQLAAACRRIVELEEQTCSVFTRPPVSHHLNDAALYPGRPRMQMSHTSPHQQYHLTGRHRNNRFSRGMDVCDGAVTQTTVSQ